MIIDMELVRVGKFSCKRHKNCDVRVFLIGIDGRGFIDFEHDKVDAFEVGESYSTFIDANQRFEELIDVELEAEGYDLELCVKLTAGYSVHATPKRHRENSNGTEGDRKAD